jgi:hypothetical protein
MSEFTDGILFLAKHTDVVQVAAQELNQPYIVRKLNEKWASLFPEDSNIVKPELANWLHKHSYTVPFLYFQHAEDHGWGYNIFKNGQEVASLDINYELDFHIWLDLAEQRYPGIDVIGSLDDAIAEALRREVANSEAYIRAVQDQFKHKNLIQLASFDIPKQSITDLDILITPERYLSDYGFDQVEEFKETIGITEMSWLSYRYLSRGNEES